MPSDEIAAGRAALSLCEALLLALRDKKVLHDSEIVDLASDAASPHRCVAEVTESIEFHLSVAALLDRIIINGDYYRVSRVAKGRLVLVVEGEPLVRLEIVDVLRSSGFDVVDVGSTDEAKAVFEQHPHIALVCTELRLPGAVDGLELAR